METPEERMKKTDTVSKILIIDFIKTLEQTMSELKLNKKTATISNCKNENNQEKETNKSITSEADSFDFLD